jgi:hypothetical protein
VRKKRAKERTEENDEEEYKIVWERLMRKGYKEEASWKRRKRMMRDMKLVWEWRGRRKGKEGEGERGRQAEK